MTFALRYGVLSTLFPVKLKLLILKCKLYFTNDVYSFFVYKTQLLNQMKYLEGLL